MLRKISFLALALSMFFFNAQAQIHDPCSGLEIILEGLDLQPSGDFLQYAVVAPPPNLTGPVSFVENRIKKVKPGYTWGYGVGIGYLFPCTNKDLKAHWQHLSTDDTNRVIATDGEVVEIPFILNSSFFFDTARGSVSFDYDAVDLNIGQNIYCFRCFQTRLYAGVRYARLEREFKLIQQGPSFVDVPLSSIDITTNVRANGAGPQIGINSTYFIWCGFGIEGDLSVSGIIEKSKSSTLAHAHLNLSDIIITTLVKPDDQIRAVPAIEGKLGLQYCYRFCTGTSLKISAGYQYADYIGAFNEIVIATGLNNGVSSLDFRKVDASFAGPYLRVAVKI